MSEINELELNLYGGDKAAANLMAGISSLSDVQAMLVELNGTASNDKVSEELGRLMREVDHAKEHLIESYTILHKEKGLPGELIIVGGKKDGDET